MGHEKSIAVLTGSVEGPVISCKEGLSFWGGVDPATGKVTDVHHPLHGTCLTGSVLFMPTSRGSCSGSGVILDMILKDRAPAALIFSEAEDILTLGALIGSEMFGKSLPVIRLAPDKFELLSRAQKLKISPNLIEADEIKVALEAPALEALDLNASDQAMLAGEEGEAVRQAMRIICAMANQQGAQGLIDVRQGHIDGCIYASPANLIFAEKIADMGAKVRIPTTMNAISVDLANWQNQGVPIGFGEPAARLAKAYVRMGCQPSFTCSPYLLDSAPKTGDVIAWAESNAVVFANTVLGARTAKHPDFLDLFIALTGRAPDSGVYLEENRKASRIIDVDLPDALDDGFWPVVGYLAGKKAPDCIPLLRGLAAGQPSRDDLKALCAAFGTTSAAPMLHIEGVTPEAHLPAAADADFVKISANELIEAWTSLNSGPEEVELVAIGSPHASLEECHAFAEGLSNALAGQARKSQTAIIITAGQSVIDACQKDGTFKRLQMMDVQLLPDLCWCSISEPVFPIRTRALITNSGKYAHYGPGLSGRIVRFGSLSDCVEAAIHGRVAPRQPGWFS